MSEFQSSLVVPEYARLFDRHTKHRVFVIYVKVVIPERGTWDLPCHPAVPSLLEVVISVLV